MKIIKAFYSVADTILPVVMGGLLVVNVIFGLV